MSSSLKNITIVLVILTCAVLGYYIYAQKDSISLNLEGSEVGEDMFASVQNYTTRREVLNKITLKNDVLRDERFTSLVSYGTPVASVPVGRKNPFESLTPVKKGNNN